MALRVVVISNFTSIVIAWIVCFFIPQYSNFSVRFSGLKYRGSIIIPRAVVQNCRPQGPILRIQRSRNSKIHNNYNPSI